MKTTGILKEAILILTILFFFSGCNKSKDFSEQTPEPTGTFDNKNTGDGRRISEGTVDLKSNVLTASMDKVVDDKISLAFSRMVIKTGNINIEIEKFDESEKKISEEVAKAKGYITNTTSNLNASEKKQGTIQVRIPAENYDSFIAGISSIGKVMSENITGRDVTEEYIDLDARQKTQKELEKRLLELLSEKTAKLTDVVEVEEKLSSVRENIEATEGRLRYLKDQSAFSTLTISLYEPSLLQTSTGGGFLYEISDAFKKGMTGFTDVLTGLITFFIAFSPVLIFLVIVYVVIKKIILKRKKRAAVPVQAG